MNKTLTSVNVRMYCTGFGDCFLLTFAYDDASAKQMLIDCGVRGGQAEDMVKIAQHLRDHGLLNESAGQKKLDYLVITHEHEDHISGFRQAQKVFDTLAIDQLWLGWTEKPDYDPAQDWKKYKTDARKALKMAFSRLPDDARSSLLADGLGARQSAPGQLLGEMLLFEVAPEALNATNQAPTTTANSHHDNPIYERLIEQVKSKAEGQVQYFMPGDLHTGLPGVRVYLLGPPPIEYIRMGESHAPGELYVDANYTTDPYSFARGLEQPRTFQECVNKAPFDEEYIIPINFTGPSVGDMPPLVVNGTYAEQIAHVQFENLKNMEVYKRYFSREMEAVGRTINDDWWQSADGMALKLNSYTNNTSLVMAIELVDTSEVLFFPGDAQYGVWRAWEDDLTNAQSIKDYQRKYAFEVPDPNAGTRSVTVEELLKRTVFYKVGHHGSHNATPRKTGLEKMTSPRLFAVLPTNAQTAMRYGWDSIPYPNLLTAFGNPKRPVRFARADELDKASELAAEFDKAAFQLTASTLRLAVDAENSYVDCTISLPVSG